jgi:hypothetical protein
MTIGRLVPGVFELNVEGSVHAEDYELLSPLVEGSVREQGKVSFLIHLSELTGMSLPAMWEDLKLYVRHHKDVARVAMVSVDSAPKWMATLSKAFLRAEVRFYPETDVAAARAWVTERSIA